MRKKSAKLTKFINGLHKYVVTHPQFRKRTAGKSEVHIQAEIRPLIISYLEKWFHSQGYIDSVGKAHKSFYWEGQEGKFGLQRATTFGSRNYPDFIITEPYLVAIEYKQSQSGSLVKQGIGQSIMHTLTDEFHYVYYLFHDESPDGRIEKSIKNKKEKDILSKMWDDYNIFVRFV